MTSKSFQLQACGKSETLENFDWLEQDNLSPSLKHIPMMKQNKEQITQQFEEIIENQLNSILVKRNSILRDFSKIRVKKTDYQSICENKNDYATIYASGSGMTTSWFLYNSRKRNKLFMIWISEKMSGFRDDIQRIEFI